MPSEVVNNEKYNKITCVIKCISLLLNMLIKITQYHVQSNRMLITGSNEVSKTIITTNKTGSWKQLDVIEKFPIMVLKEIGEVIWETMGPRGIRIGSGQGFTMTKFIVCTVHLT